MHINSVMIIDDSESDQFLAKTVIKKFSSDIDILQAYDGQEALEMLGELKKQPDAIFLDINMPRMNGHDFLKKYDTWEKQTLIVVMLTSSDQKLDKEKSRAYKCVKEYFTKPLDTAALEAVLQISSDDA